MKEKKSFPIRRCVGCSQRSPKEELVRIVKSPDGNITIDCSGKSPGRGAYLCRNLECLKKARKKRRLEQNLKGAISNEVFEAIEKEIGGDG